MNEIKELKMTTKPQILRRVLLLAGFYLAALMATLPFPPTLEWLWRASYVWAFPMGLWFFCFHSFGSNTDVLSLLLGYGIYLGLMVWALVARRREVLVVVCAVVCLVLVINVSGCRKAWSAVKEELQKTNPE